MQVLTRRVARMIQNCVLNVLPNEVITEILYFCDRSSQAVLCLVSKHFQQLALRLLYEIIELNEYHHPRFNGSKIGQFHAVLDVKPEYAPLVKDLSLRSGNYGVGSSISGILRKTAELRPLSLSAPAYSLDFDQLSFLNLAQIITPFLNRHSTLEELSSPHRSEIPK
ncbi:hypothetical protein C8J56DRAFT_65042 [Mycena floridula]|nr:hypothetical protein C8J56DRAFT_65042 [Mycena floridula]